MRASSSPAVVEGADHHGVNITRQHARGIGDGLAAAELVWPVSTSVSPPRAGAWLHRTTPACGLIRLVEDHREHFSREQLFFAGAAISAGRFSSPAILLKSSRAIPLARNIGEIDEMT